MAKRGILYGLCVTIVTMALPHLTVYYIRLNGYKCVAARRHTLLAPPLKKRHPPPSTPFMASETLSRQI